MLETIKNAWKIPDLRKKILFTLAMLVVFRFGSFIPVPGINTGAMADFVGNNQNTIFGIMDLFSGGALSQATIFAMGVSPYINSSIIMNLLTVAIPALERLAKEGEEGRKKIQSITRVVTIGLAIVQALGLYFLMFNQQLLTNNSLNFVDGAIIIITLTAGTAFIMWLGEQITEYGIGNGISIIIFAGIVERIPKMAQSLWFSYKDMNITGYIIIAAVVLVVLVMIGFVVLFDSAERKIPVQYAKRVVGRKMYGGQSTHIPLKVTMSGVIPIIFAMSILSFPGTIIQLFNASDDGFWKSVGDFLSPSSGGYAILYFFLIIAFTYFYTSISFNPIEVSNNMKKNGGFIPGIRPGKPTSDFITRVLSRITLAGAIFLALVAVIPSIMAIIDTRLAAVSIGGSSLLILVGVALETVRQIESQMLMRHYKGFLE